MLINRKKFLSVFDAFVAGLPVNERSISRRFFKDPGRITVIRDEGAGMNISTLNTLLITMSNEWPEGAEWPADVYRPLREALDADFER